MTILAYEATEAAQNILVKYGKCKVKTYPELEQALADLYFSGVDKIQLERDLAAIHPHKKFLAKYLPPVIKEVKVEVIKEIPATAAPAPEIKSNAEGPAQNSNNQTSLMKDYITLFSVLGLVTISVLLATNKIK